MVNYPASCAFGHAPLTFNDDTALQSHIAAQHPGEAPAVLGALTSQAGSSHTTINIKTPKTALARLGIVAADLASRETHTVLGGIDLTEFEVKSVITDYCAGLPAPFDVDFGFFLLDFTLLYIETCGSEDWSQSGTFVPYNTSKTPQDPIVWADFKTYASTYFGDRKKLFTPRKMGRALDAQMEEIYSLDLPAFSKLRSYGSNTSRRFKYPGGAPLECWVAVPDLWPHRLTLAQLEMREHVKEAVKKFKKTETSDYHYLGLDPELTTLKREASKAGHKAKVEASKHPGLGSPGASGHPAVMRSLYPHLFVPSGESEVS